MFKISMNIKFSINTELKRDLTIDKLKLALFLSMIKLQELAVIGCPVDTGRLRNSININPATPGFLTYTVSDGTDYGVNVEFGTKPHYTSVGNLEDWSRRVLGDKKLAYAVRNNIAKYGTQAQPFFRPAMQQVKNIWIRRYVNQVLSSDNNV